MSCKKCGCDEIYKEMKGPHLGMYCKRCNAWQAWEKHTDNPKTKEEYRDEYMDKQPATELQIIYIKNLLKQVPVSKLKAREIIRQLGGEVE